jgi:hypothetical protein
LDQELILTISFDAAGSLLTDVEEHQKQLDGRQSEAEQRIKRLEWQLEEKLKMLNGIPANMATTSSPSDPSA